MYNSHLMLRFCSLKYSAISRIFIIIFLTITIVSCTNKASNDEQKKVFSINLDDGLTSLDPAFARNRNALWITNQLFNGLVQIDDSLRTIPAIAKSWDISPDRKTYTFHLRKDVYFHNDPIFKNGRGRLVVASDFVYSFSR